VVGSFLVALMSVITFVVSRIISQAGQPGAGARFTGSPSDVNMIYGIFAVVIAIGLVSIAGGIMTLRYGKASKVVFVVIIALALVFYLMAMAFNRS
jgi:hypothetical protein